MKPYFCQVKETKDTSIIEADSLYDAAVFFSAKYIFPEDGTYHLGIISCNDNVHTKVFILTRRNKVTGIKPALDLEKDIYDEVISDTLSAFLASCKKS